jgi:aspartyl-tRNA(Asn)/glutamyl-tRNA(Gln) amidotransferase subunit B
VFYPDLRSASEAAVVVETLRNLLRHIGTCDGKMEEGSLRCDLNVSITPLEDNTQDEDILKLTGNRVEVKNLNSIRQIQQAAKYEAIRQAEAYINGDPSGRETRTFDVKSGKTIVIRSKEGAKDYRFMPEPDLPPVVLDNEAFGGMSLESFLDMALPELPNDARDRLQRDYGLSAYLAGVLTGDPPSIQLFDTAVQEARKQLSGERQLKAVPESVANLLCNGLFALKRETDLKVKETLGVENSVEFSKVDGEQLGEIVALIVEGTISNTMAKQLLKVLHDEDVGKKARQVAKERGFKLITDKEELAKICHDIISTSPEEMERYNMGGKYAQKIKKFLLGKAMAATGGNAHPERLNEILMEVLEEIEPDVN